MMYKWMMAGAAALAVTASSARAQGSDPRLARKLDAQTLVAVEAVIDSARALGLPTEPLADRAFEYAAKGRPGASIVAAVRTRAVQLGTAKRALATTSDREVIAGADALANNVPESTLAELRRARTTAELTIPLSVLADLVARGAQIDTASAVVIALVGTNMRDGDMIKFRQTVERDIALGTLPAAAALTRGEAALGALDSPGTNNGQVRGPIIPSPKPPIKP